MHQLLRIPILFAHFKDHQSEQRDITILDYLSQHYLLDNDADNRHDELPFKHKHCEIFHMVLAVVPGLNFSNSTSVFQSNVPLVSYEPQLHSQSAAASIWQPPMHLLC